MNEQGRSDLRQVPAVGWVHGRMNNRETDTIIDDENANRDTSNYHVSIL